ncbi:MAG: DEAD/DEAH box helicase [Pseudoalteromonas sp.]|uniref:DEAD/DEAH box helicase n=1 Tax=Pseudoalteromonas sp. TaxID=53249 RepID=UPI001D61EA9C|nr:DEAD/DEAH box helicase [Pseudoalteromonas sp.]NRA80356.1 DEAD/DEAH box helicase [Pseudoalteromonas sp.]
MMELKSLESFGIKHAWQVPLICPVEIEDYTNIVTEFSKAYQLSGHKIVIAGKLVSAPSFNWVRGKGVLTIELFDDLGYLLSIKLFGDTKHIEESLTEVGSTYYFKGVSFANGAYLNLRAAKLISSADIGKFVPIYKSKRGYLSKEQVREVIRKQLPSTLNQAEKYLREVIKWVPNIRQVLKTKKMTLKDVLTELHNPSSVESWEEARGVIKRIAALYCIREMNALNPREPNKLVNSLHGLPINVLKEKIPFELTTEQTQIVESITNKFKEGTKVDGALIGDVGTGKTVVYGICAASVVSAGGRAAIMLPSQTLAEQIHEELNSYFGSLKPVLVTLETEQTNLEETNFLIGTSALLHRRVGVLDLVVVDEQHRFGLEQRELLLSENTHFLEATATPIPRTQALISYGNSKHIFRLTKCHAKKEITTKLRLKSESHALMKECLNQVELGNKVLVVCPTKDNSENFASVEEVFTKWNKFARNKVRYIHSGCSPDHNRKSIADIKSGKASILISTTMVEIGLTIPRLTKTIIYHAERFGTITCHQIRGRLVRHGGKGQLDLYCPTEIGEKSLQRLLLLTKFDDGYELAEQDMILRGFGDIVKASDLSQSGSTKSILIGEKVDVSDVEEILSTLETTN